MNRKKSEIIHQKDVPRMSLAITGYWVGGYRRASKKDQINRTFEPRQFIPTSIPTRSKQACKVCSEPMLVSVGQIANKHKFHNRERFIWT